MTSRTFCDGVGRRDFLRIGTAGLFGMGVTLPGLLQLQAHASTRGRAASDLSLIFLFLHGGLSTIDTFDLKPEAPAEFRGEFRPIATNVPGIQICEHFPRLARRMDKICQVRSMTHDNGDHISSTHYLLTGEPPPRDTDKRAQWPHLGAVLSALGRGSGPLPPFVSLRPKLPNDVPRFVEESQGQFGGWLGPLHDPLTIDADPSLPDYRVGELTLQPELSVERLEQRRELLATLDRRLDGFSPQFAALDMNH